MIICFARNHSLPYHSAQNLSGANLTNSDRQFRPLPRFGAFAIFRRSFCMKIAKAWNCGGGLKCVLKSVLEKLGLIDRLFYYGPGTRFGASRPFDCARSIAFCTFLRHFLCLAWLWMTVFFFSLLERHSQSPELNWTRVTPQHSSVPIILMFPTHQSLNIYLDVLSRLFWASSAKMEKGRTVTKR